MRPCHEQRHSLHGVNAFLCEQKCTGILITSLYFGAKYLPFGLICFVNAFSKALFMSLQAAGWSHKQSWNVTRTVLASNLLGTTCFPSKSPAFFSCVEKGHISIDDPHKQS